MQHEEGRLADRVSEPTIKAATKCDGGSGGGDSIHFDFTQKQVRFEVKEKKK